MLLQPLFEFSGACAGCGETPYIRLATQLFGDRMLVANATGCSSIYGGNLPTTPYTRNANGRGPAWSIPCSRTTPSSASACAWPPTKLMPTPQTGQEMLAGQLRPALVDALLTSRPAQRKAGIRTTRARRRTARRPQTAASASPGQLAAVAEYLIRRSVWIIGGDGWAYDIGFGGLDHVLASGRNINILVLDTEVFQHRRPEFQGHATGAVAKFAGGRQADRQEGPGPHRHGLRPRLMSLPGRLRRQGRAYRRRLSSMRKATPACRSSPTAHCIAHGVDLSFNLRQQDLAGRSGMAVAALRPASARTGRTRFGGQCRTIHPYRDFAQHEARFMVLERLHPADANRLMKPRNRLAAAATRNTPISPPWPCPAPAADNSRRGEQECLT